MAQEYLALLNSAANVTSQVFGQINQSLSNANKIQLETNQQELQARGQALNIVETARMHDAQIAQMNHEAAFKSKQFEFQSELQAKAYELQNEIQPLRVMNERLRIEEAGAAAKLRNVQANMLLHDRMTAPYNELAANDWLRTQDPVYANDLLTYSADWQTRVANGEKFNAVEYTKGLEELKSKYDINGPVQVPSWDPKTQNVINRFSPSTGTIYNRSNPSISGQRNTAAVSFLDVDVTDKAGSDSANRFFAMANEHQWYSNEEWGNINSAKFTYNQNLKTIDRKSKEIATIQGTKGAAYRGPDMEALENDINGYRAQNQTIIQNFSKGQFDMHKQEVVVPPVKQLGSDIPKETVLQVPVNEDPSDQRNRKLVGGMRQTAQILGIDAGKDESINTSILSGVTPKYFDKDNITPDIGQSRDFGSKVMDKVKNNLIDPSKGGPSNINKVLEAGTLDSLIKKIKPNTDIPLDPATIAILKRNNIRSSGIKIQSSGSVTNPMAVMTQSGQEKYFFSAEPGTGGWFDFSGAAHSSNDIYNIINKIQDPTEREHVRQQLAAALVASSIVSDITE